MEREILFKAKQADDAYGLWVEGNLAYDDVMNVYEDDEWVEYDILPQTVCQYTGVLDKNGNKIFDGDIIKTDSYEFIVKYGNCDKDEDNKSGYIGFYVIGHDKKTQNAMYPERWSYDEVFSMRNDLCFYAHKSVVVGNIYDDI